MSHRYDELIVDAMRTLAGAGSEGSPIGSSLAELTATAVSLIDRVDCADVLMISGGTFESISATRPVARELDQVQQQTGAGPCLDAADRDVMVRCSDLANDDRWPEYAEHAQAVGVFSVMSFRLFTQGSDSGALNLLGFRPRTFTDEEEALGAMLATQAALLILAADRQRQFDSALASRDIIGQAKGVIMERFDVDAIQAFALLTKLSQETNTPLRVIAERLVERKPNGLSR
ncbi:hypothetical protein Y900_029680 [Mycolicibacterium aromaticivorans JS19b1 = JCM 16368]|uniref:ANTAR domain-containing protein n=1 Tax=Mycolicibacterium aromaticivorans JS19b1 = JCM 16368 TaxID=1440774 RepID=A0A064C952_9MYCO|nr:GAF and ANTAR domain-containing protein [Mycolicibacterium aromaticivorans]KDE96810.1 hypothetical protein Y900_029680 [Mycolicibacterium aromaticivorans JS19b1 = JCM 16368]